MSDIINDPAPTVIADLVYPMGINATTDVYLAQVHATTEALGLSPAELLGDVLTKLKRAEQLDQEASEVKTPPAYQPDFGKILDGKVTASTEAGKLVKAAREAQEVEATRAILTEAARQAVSVAESAFMASGPSVHEAWRLALPGLVQRADESLAKVPDGLDAAGIIELDDPEVTAAYRESNATFAVIFTVLDLVVTLTHAGYFPGPSTGWMIPTNSRRDPSAPPYDVADLIFEHPERLNDYGRLSPRQRFELGRPNINTADQMRAAVVARTDQFQQWVRDQNGRGLLVMHTARTA